MKVGDLGMITICIEWCYDLSPPPISLLSRDVSYFPPTQHTQPITIISIVVVILPVIHAAAFRSV